MQQQNTLKHCALAACACLSVLGNQVLLAQDVTIDRYLSTPLKPTLAQQDLLQQRLEIKFPQNILTIEQAIQFTLQFSGYRLVDLNALQAPVREMLSQPLAQINRSFGPMTLEQALETLVGPAFCLLVDPVHRLISFQLKPAYRKLYIKKSKHLDDEHPEEAVL